jgi:hypothetical protein
MRNPSVCRLRSQQLFGFLQYAEGISYGMNDFHLIFVTGVLFRDLVLEAKNKKDIEKAEVGVEIEIVDQDQTTD